MKRSSSRFRKRRGEDYLADIEAVRITLENGEKATFNIARETSIPSDDKLREAARKSSARVAFWGYQAARALARVRQAERKLEHEEGMHYRIARNLFLEEGWEITEPRLRAWLAERPELRRFRVALDSARREHGLLSAVRDAVDHRAWMVRALVTRREE